MAFEENQVLFGHDPTPGIVGAEFDGASSITLYLRQPDGSTTSRTETLRPFFWLGDAPFGIDLAITALGGDLKLRFLGECADWKEFTRVRTVLRNSGATHYAFGDPVQQFLARTGMTLFKGMMFADLRRMQLGMDGSTVVVSDPSGSEERLEHEVATRLNEIIARTDPDVIEGHDLFKRTLPAIAARARNAGVKLAWGRDGSALANKASRIQVAEKTINYPKYEMHGRHFVDTYLLAQFYDVSVRELESYELADVAAHFHLAEGSPARRAGELAALLGASYFEQARIFPYNYQDVVVRGTATRIDALLLREYLRQSHSIPDLPEPRPFEGGYTDIFHTGIARNVWHCDVASLYPSVMLRFDCLPANDHLQVFRGLLTDLRKFRLEARARMRTATSARDRHEWNALQTTFKILINSFYGYLGFAQAHFADFDAASRVTQIGRDLLKRMVAWLQEHGAQVIEIDTDGIYFVPGGDVEKLRLGLAAELPGGIDVEFDANYEAMFSYKAKNYALLAADGTMTITGGALKSRGLEKFQRVFMEELIRLLMAGQPDKIAALHAEFERKIRAREWPIEFLMKTETLQDSLSQYAKKIAGSARNRAAAYELAAKSGRHFQPGDQVSYYITGSKKNVSAYENSKLASEFDPAARDENVEYYVAKLGELLKKFSGFVAKPEARAQMELL
jgi:DNA polymerase I